MQWDKIQFFLALSSLIALSVSYWYVSKKDKVTNIDKGIITALSLCILFCGEKIKLLLWLLFVGGIFLIKYKNKNKSKKNELT